MSKVQVQKLHTLTGHRDCVYTIQPAADAHTFFSASGDGMVVMWDLTNPDQGQLIAKLPNSVYAIHYHGGSGLLIVGHNYDGIHLLDWKNKVEVGSLQLTKAAIFDIQSLDGFLYVASGEGALHRIRADGLQVVGKDNSSAKSARTIAIDKTRGEMAVGYSDNFIRIFDVDSLQVKQQWQAHANSVFTLRFTEDGKLISGSRDARLKVWDPEGQYRQVGEVVAHLYAINHVDFSPDKKHFVTCSLDKTIKVWEAKDLKLLKVIDRARHAGHITSVNKVLWSSYKDQLLSASDDRTISVWHIIF